VEAGERALVWRCGKCGTRYAVPVALARSVVIPCERCGNPVDLTPEKSVGEEALMDPFAGAVNATRRQLAGFFREAMARGFTVLVAGEDAGA
jgi:DNA-directed RNA polymerase subunit RPC12/RpoP